MQQIPRAHRFCQVCAMGEVEDLPHFLLRCPRYFAIRAEFHSLFSGVVDTAVLFNSEDQAALVHADVSMLQFRKVALQVAGCVRVVADWGVYSFGLRD
jgi:hypothetical protein